MNRYTGSPISGQLSTAWSAKHLQQACSWHLLGSIYHAITLPRLRGNRLTLGCLLMHMPFAVGPSAGISAHFAQLEGSLCEIDRHLIIVQQHAPYRVGDETSSVLRLLTQNAKRRCLHEKGAHDVWFMGRSVDMLETKRRSGQFLGTIVCTNEIHYCEKLVSMIAHVGCHVAATYRYSVALRSRTAGRARKDPGSVEECGSPWDRPTSRGFLTSACRALRRLMSRLMSRLK